MLLPRCEAPHAVRSRRPGLRGRNRIASSGPPISPARPAFPEETIRTDPPPCDNCQKVVSPPPPHPAPARHPRKSLPRQPPAPRSRHPAPTLRRGPMLRLHGLRFRGRRFDAWPHHNFCDWRGKCSSTPSSPAWRSCPARAWRTRRPPKSTAPCRAGGAEKIALLDAGLRADLLRRNPASAAPAHRPKGRARHPRPIGPVHGPPDRAGKSGMCAVATGA